MKTEERWYVWGEWPKLPWIHSCYNFSLALELRNQTGVDIPHLAADYHNGTSRTFMRGSEWLKTGEQYLTKVLESPHILEEDLIAIETSANELFAFSAGLMKKRSVDLSRTEIKAAYQKFHHYEHSLWSAGMVPNLLELNQSLLSDYLKNKIGVDEQKWHILITPTELSSAQIEERDFLKLAINIGKRAKIVNKNELKAHFETDQKLYTLFKAHYQKYRWIQYGWIGPSLDEQYFLDRMTDILRRASAEKSLVALVAQDHALVQERDILDRHLNLDTHTATLVKLLRRILFDKAYRMDALYQSYYCMEPILEKMAKIYGLSLDELRMIHGTELLPSLVSGKINHKFLQEAIEYSAYIKENNELRFYVGNKARKAMRQILSDIKKEKPNGDLKGQAAFLGKVQGRARLIFTTADIHKIKNGDILISHATDPSLLPAMEKAAAFVTDMGGLTCHAAIVAREMHKPCIVGTKIATKVLKDGDVVEVDAYNGTVRKVA